MNVRLYAFEYSHTYTARTPTVCVAGFSSLLDVKLDDEEGDGEQDTDEDNVDAEKSGAAHLPHGPPDSEMQSWTSAAISPAAHALFAECAKWAGLYARHL